MALQKVRIYMLERVAGCLDHGCYISPYAEHEMAHNKGEVICLGEQIISVDFPEIDTRQLQIETLELAVKTEAAESQGRVNVLLDRISKLKCLTHEVKS